MEGAGSGKSNERQHLGARCRLPSARAPTARAAARWGERARKRGKRHRRRARSPLLRLKAPLAGDGGEGRAAPTPHLCCRV